MPVDQASTGAFQLKWELRKHGWARCHLAEGSRRTSLTVSYGTDALADLVSAAGLLYGGYGERRTARFFFDAEPQELRWVVRAGEAAGEDEVDVTVYRFPDVGVVPALPDAEGTVLWRSAHPRGVFAHAVLDAAQGVLAEHGEAGYRARWVLHPFPAGPLQDLRRLHLRDDGCPQPH
ncbi:hypothetical protein [Streptomyces sp. NPDC056600]|uniref:hypothetical protein n=1 Tax=Streptomyces sp. NPDC056600 TaxID=3345874 RepID=UPI0036900B93